MSDATDFTAALAELKWLVEADDHPALTYGDGSTIDTTRDLDRILENTKRAVTFTTPTLYTVGQIVMPTTRNGYRYRVTVPGTSGAEPTWPTSEQGRVESGVNSPVLTFEEAGPEFDSVYNLRKACRAAVAKKMSKAANDNQYMGDSRGTASSYLFLNLQRLYAQFEPMEIA